MRSNATRKKLAGFVHEGMGNCFPLVNSPGYASLQSAMQARPAQNPWEPPARMSHTGPTKPADDVAAELRQVAHDLQSDEPIQGLARLVSLLAEPELSNACGVEQAVSVQSVARCLPPADMASRNAIHFMLERMSVGTTVRFSDWVTLFSQFTTAHLHVAYVYAVPPTSVDLETMQTWAPRSHVSMRLVDWAAMCHAPSPALPDLVRMAVHMERAWLATSDVPINTTVAWVWPQYPLARGDFRLATKVFSALSAVEWSHGALQQLRAYSLAAAATGRVLWDTTANLAGDDTVPQLMIQYLRRSPTFEGVDPIALLTEYGLCSIVRQHASSAAWRLLSFPAQPVRDDDLAHFLPPSQPVVVTTTSPTPSAFDVVMPDQ
jgi:hypothetical protein